MLSSAQMSHIISELVETGFSYIPDLYNQKFCQDIIDASESMIFERAHIGRGAGKLLDSEIRTDRISWLNEKSPEAMQKYLAEMHEFKNELNRELYLGINTFDGHLATYQAGAFYKKHLDQHPDSRERVLSTILYLNSAPHAESGGEIRLFQRSDKEKIERDIAPQRGAFLCFMSDQIYHEVLVSHFERRSLTGWMSTNQL